MSATENYSLKISRTAMLRSLSNRILRRYVMRRAETHLKNGDPQLAVFSFDIIGVTIVLEGQYEREELSVLGSWLAYRLGDRLGDGVALDCGANIGNHSVFFSGLFGKEYRFEPNPRTSRLLQFNSYDLQNVECLNLGLSDRDGSFELSVLRTNVGGASLSNTALATGSADTISVEMKTLDGLDLALDNLLFIKIDVEGHELSALRGAKGVIGKYRPLVAFEQATTEISNGTRDVIDWLRDRGYNCFYCIKKTPRIGSRVGGKLGAMARMFIFGQYLEVTPTDRFEKKYYPLIIPRRRPWKGPEIGIFGLLT